MSDVKMKFSLQQVIRMPYTTDGETKEATNITLSPVKGDPFGPSTPSGTLNAVIVNPDAAKVFNDASIGQEFDIILSPVQAPAPAPAPEGEQPQV
jgi:hypothetical protein